MPFRKPRKHKETSTKILYRVSCLLSTGSIQIYEHFYQKRVKKNWVWLPVKGNWNSIFTLAICWCPGHCRFWTNIAAYVICSPHESGLVRGGVIPFETADAEASYGLIFMQPLYTSNCFWINVQKKKCAVEFIHLSDWSFKSDLLSTNRD